MISSSFKDFKKCDKCYFLKLITHVIELVVWKLLLSKSYLWPFSHDYLFSVNILFILLMILVCIYGLIF